MKRCVVFCAAGFDGLAIALEPSDLIIAADGGLAHTNALGIRPDLILGDFDSLGYVPQDSRVYPVEKDDTDLMLAIRTGLEKGCSEFIFYGALDGPRLDHTVASFQALNFLCARGAFGWLVGKDYIITSVRNGTLFFPPEATGILSVFCQGADAKGVTLSGLHYPLTDGVLSAGFPLGVSNHFTGESAAVEVRDGTLLVMWDRSNGLCRRE